MYVLFRIGSTKSSFRPKFSPPGKVSINLSQKDWFGNGSVIQQSFQI
jgi:hypothetical protein